MSRRASGARRPDFSCQSIQVYRGTARTGACGGTCWRETVTPEQPAQLQNRESATFALARLGTPPTVVARPGISGAWPSHPPPTFQRYLHRHLILPVHLLGSLPSLCWDRVRASMSIRNANSLSTVGPPPRRPLARIPKGARSAIPRCSKMLKLLGKNFLPLTLRLTGCS
jgi:hypothetical protein